MTSAATQELVRIVFERLAASDRTVVTWESPTGGGLREALSQHPAAARWYVRGLIGDGSEPLDGDEVVSDRDAVVPEMVTLTLAEAARKVCGSSYSVVVTGDAGPIIGDSPHWVETVCIAVAGPDGHIVNAHGIEGDRDLVLRVTIDLALVMLVALIDDDVVRRAD